MSALKPCPFCGKEAIVIANNYRHLQTTYAFKCSNIECRVIPITYEHSEMQDAIEAWNRRASHEVD